MLVEIIHLPDHRLKINLTGIHEPIEFIGLNQCLIFSLKFFVAFHKMMRNIGRVSCLPRCNILTADRRGVAWCGAVV